MENVKEFFASRTSVRRYEREPITDEQLDAIYEAIRNTPTSYNGQQFSVIDISDQEIKLKLYEITNQKQIKTCSHFMVFCADYHKILRLAVVKGVDTPAFHHTLDGVMIGVIDAALAMQNAVIASRMLGLGSCCVGYARTANPRKIAELLNLPKGVFVVCGLAIGVPREQPDVKPKQPISAVIHSNVYTTEGMTAALEGYDAQVSEYNRTRSGSTSTNDWCAHIVDYYREAMKYRIRDYIVEQGFDVMK